MGHPEHQLGALTPLEEREGLFGPVRVFTDTTHTWMLIGNQVQGGRGHDGSNYCPHVSSLVQLCGNTTSILMIGLGFGEAVCAILEANPSANVTCVEIDPVIFELAMRYNPSLSVHVHSGRCCVVIGDALNWVKYTQDRYDVGVADAYQGNNEVFLPWSLILGLNACCDYVVLNTLGENRPQLGLALQSLGTPISILTHDDASNVLYSFSSL